jgi:hypothetical protein
LDLGFVRKIAEMERYVDPGEEGFVEYFDAIGGEEEDAAIVLDVSETI